MPEIVVVVAIVVEILAFLARMYMLPLTVKGFKPSLFLRDVILKCCIVVLLSAPIPMLFIYQKTSTHSS